MRFRALGVFVLVLILSTALMSGDSQQEELKDATLIRLKSISFNHNQKCNCGKNCVDAIDILKLFPEEKQEVRKMVPVPEWGNDFSYPVCYIAKSKVNLIVVFSADKKVIRAKIGAKKIKGELGDIAPKHVTFDQKTNSAEVSFCLTIPDAINLFNQKWRWYYNELYDSKSGIKKEGENFAVSKNKIYIVLAQPEHTPWDINDTKPWVEALEEACYWARREVTQFGAAEKITENLYYRVGGRYSDEGSFTSFSGNPFSLERFLKALPYADSVNCYDMGKAVVTFANVVGCDLTYKEIGVENLFWHLKLIGRHWSTFIGFLHHGFASCSTKDAIFDATFLGCKNPKCILLAGVSMIDYIEEMSGTGNDYSAIPYTFSLGEMYGEKMSNCFLERIEFVKGEYHYDTWPSKIAKILPNSVLNDKIMPYLNNLKLKRVWKEDIVSTENIQKSVFSIIRQSWEDECDRLAVTVVRGSTIEDVNKYLVFRYSGWSGKPNCIKKLKIGNIGFEIKENSEESPLHVDFIRNNVLIMFQGEGKFKNTLRKMAVELDKIMSEKNTEEVSSALISNTSSSKKMGRIGVGNNFDKKKSNRRLYVHVKKPNSSELNIRILNTKRNPEFVPVDFEFDHVIRIFPGSSPRKIRNRNCQNKKWPSKYTVRFPKKWEYCENIKSTKKPQPKCSQEPYQIDKPHETNFRLVFHAPSDFPIPKLDKEKYKLLYQLEIEGCIPPIWWVEIIPPSLTGMDERKRNEFTKRWKNNAENVEVGDDRQPITVKHRKKDKHSNAK